MIEIKLLADCGQDVIPKLAKLWYEEIGQHWAPDETSEQTEHRFSLHANKDKLPIMYVAIENNHPIGMACLRATEGIRPELEPWLGGLVVSPSYRASHTMLHLVKQCFAKAKEMDYVKIYLVAFDKKLSKKYQRIMNCEVIGTDYIHGAQVVVMCFNI